MTCTVAISRYKLVLKLAITNEPLVIIIINYFLLNHYLLYWQSSCTFFLSLFFSFIGCLFRCLCWLCYVFSVYFVRIRLKYICFGCDMYFLCISFQFGLNIFVIYDIAQTWNLNIESAPLHQFHQFHTFILLYGESNNYKTLPCI